MKITPTENRGIDEDLFHTYVTRRKDPTNDLHITVNYGVAEQNVANHNCKMFQSLYWLNFLHTQYNLRLDCCRN